MSFITLFQVGFILMAAVYIALDRLGKYQARERENDPDTTPFSRTPKTTTDNHNPRRKPQDIDPKWLLRQILLLILKFKLLWALQLLLLIPSIRSVLTVAVTSTCAIATQWAAETAPGQESGVQARVNAALHKAGVLTTQATDRLHDVQDTVHTVTNLHDKPLDTVKEKIEHIPALLCLAPHLPRIDWTNPKEIRHWSYSYRVMQEVRDILSTPWKAVVVMIVDTPHDSLSVSQTAMLVTPSYAMSGNCPAKYLALEVTPGPPMTLTRHIQVESKTREALDAVRKKLPSGLRL